VFGAVVDGGVGAATEASAGDGSVGAAVEGSAGAVAELGGRGVPVLPAPLMDGGVPGARVMVLAMAVPAETLQNTPTIAAPALAERRHDRCARIASNTSFTP
jgi:hypothetical protein